LVFKFQKKEVMVSSDIGKEAIKKELPLIPKLPGVYRMLNEKNVILYVGKAKNLPNRLKQGKLRSQVLQMRVKRFY
jgi:excinuclease ABC subunit C